MIQSNTCSLGRLTMQPLSTGWISQSELDWPARATVKGSGVAQRQACDRLPRHSHQHQASRQFGPRCRLRTWFYAVNHWERVEMQSDATICHVRRFKDHLQR